MIRIRLVHWNQDESQSRVKKLRALGWIVDAGMPSDVGRALNVNGIVRFETGDKQMACNIASQ